MLVKHITLLEKGDERGSLTVAQLGENLPFIVKRVYWIYDTQNGVARGFHAHRKLNQFFVCVAGSVKMVFSNGFETETFTLSPFSEGVFVGPGLWREMYDFSKDCVLMVFADAEYNEDDYIRNYSDFLKYAKAK